MSTPPTSPPPPTSSTTAPPQLELEATSKRARPSNEDEDNDIDNDANTASKPKPEPQTKTGQWKTHVNLPVRVGKSDWSELKTRAAKSANRTMDMVFWCDELHVSLSRAVALYKHEVDAFRAALQERVSKCAQVARLSLRTDEFVELPGADGDEAFLAALIDEGEDGISELVDAVDECMLLFGREAYFSPRLLHVSLGRYPCRPFREPRRIKPVLEDSDSGDAGFGVEPVVASLGAHVLFTSGNLSFNVALQS